MKRLFTFLGLMLSAQLVWAQCAGLSSGFTSSVNNMTVQFNATWTPSSVPSSTVFWAWSFGDGSAGGGSAPSHTYTAPGTYTVSLATVWWDSLTSTTICMDTTYNSVTVPGGGNVISGTIYWDTTGNYLQAGFKVWLIQYDSATNMLTAVDSTTTGGVAMAPYYFYGQPAGIYYTKAAETGTTPVLMPTYHDSSLYWSTAPAITHTGSATVNNDIWMTQGNPGSGPGFISGNVSQGANKGTGAGIPGMQVFLRNAANKVVTLTYTNASGDYTFNNLPAGSYNIYPESMNYSTTPSSSLLISASQTNATGVDFERSITNKTIQPKTTSVGSVANDIFSIYPNPSEGQFTINWKAGLQGVASIDVTDMSGRLVMHTTASMNNTSHLNAAQLQQGIYMVTIRTGAEKHTERIVIAK